MSEPESNFEPAHSRGTTQTDTADSVEPAGHFRLYLGAAAGVGKTYAMLNEGHRRKQTGHRRHHRFRGMSLTSTH